MPYHFERQPITGVMDMINITFSSTSVPYDTSFSLTRKADFLIYDQKRGLEALGPSPKLEYIFNVSEEIHEAPVYAPNVNKLFISTLTQANLQQLIVDLNHDPPTIANFTSDPPTYSPNGGFYHNGLVYWGTDGGNRSLHGREYRPSILTLDPKTNKTTTLLNNYFGFYFNGIDDVVIDPQNGAVFYTDPSLSHTLGWNTAKPNLISATYRFDPHTGVVKLLDSSLVAPNGIALSPCGKYAYVSDTGSSTVISQLGQRVVFKFDRVDNGTAIANKRPVWYAEEYIADGLKVARNGFVVTATGLGVDVIDPEGVPILRIQTDFIVNNINWAGKGFEDLWLVGYGKVARVKWNLPGPVLV